MNPQDTNLLDGKYEIIKRLASGGMSEVYLVRHLHLEQQRVVKVLRPESASDPSAQARFLRSARMATQIKHPNVAILYDSAQLEDGSFYMVWEYIEGEDVGHWVERRGPFPLEPAIDLGMQALRGLETIHSHGIIHRDISPDNLMLTRDVRNRVRLKIIDLGLAKDLKLEAAADLEVTQAGVFMGKLRYCSPEQAGMVEGAILDRRTDLYSFAAVFYEMLCGLPPFESENPHGFVFKRLTEDPLPLVDRSPGTRIPRKLEKVVLRGLERDRDERYATALEFMDALDRVRKEMMQLSTREMPSFHQVAAAEATSPPEDREASPRSERSSSQLSKQEKDELLAQINQAAKRVEKTRGLMEQATRALGFGDLKTARELRRKIESIDAKAKGLVALREGLDQAEREATDPARRREEAEAMLERYLTNRQLPLAQLALETLHEIAPDHPYRAQYEARIQALADATHEEKAGAEQMRLGREALEQGDLGRAEEAAAALQELEASGRLSSMLTREIEESRRGEQDSTALAERQDHFRELLESGYLDEAQNQLDELGEQSAKDQGLAKVTVDLYRSQLEEARRVSAQSGDAQAFEIRFRQHLNAGRWVEAREAALDMDATLPGHPRPAELFAELETSRQEAERRQALSQGARQVEQLIEREQGDQARMALKVLLKLDPRHPMREIFEQRIADLGY